MDFMFFRVLEAPTFVPIELFSTATESSLRLLDDVS